MNILYAQVNPLCICRSSITVLRVGRRKLALLQSVIAFSVLSISIFIISIKFVPIALIFAWAYGRSWLSHVDEPSLMPINLFDLFDSFWTDPWSLIRWSLVQFFQETVCRLIMSAAERLFENLIIGREAKLRGQMRNFEDSLSAKDNISRQTSKPEIVYLF